MIKVYFFKRNIIILVFFLIFTNIPILINTFNYHFYTKKYKTVPKNPIKAFYHYLNYGFYQQQDCATPIKNTNFDWKHYVNHNNLDINNSKNAKIHYKTIGKFKKLDYCKKFKIVIILHLYNLDLADEFIEKINYFMSINKHNEFYIKINIPIDKNINQNKIFLKNINELNQISHNIKLKKILKNTPYHKNLINLYNINILYALYKNLKNNLKLPNNNIKIIFSENRGADIGGFFLCIDQIIKENLNFDYMVKVHTKSHKSWREILTSILNLRINKLLRKYQYICNCYMETSIHSNLMHLMKTDILKKFNMPYKENFGHTSGTMFIASKKIIEFFQDKDILALFNTLNTGDYFHNFLLAPGFRVEHEYEAFFGYLANHLNLKHKIIGYIKR